MAIFEVIKDDYKNIRVNGKSKLVKSTVTIKCDTIEGALNLVKIYTDNGIKAKLKIYTA